MNTGFLGPAVATVLTVYGIETPVNRGGRTPESGKLQQYLPFTVLKRFFANFLTFSKLKLQQYLPFTVLKLD